MKISHRTKVWSLGAVIATVAGTALSSVQIPQGIRFIISPEGQKYFENHFEELLLSHEVDLSKMKFEKTNFTLDEPFSAQKLPQSIRERQGDLLKRLSANFALYFSGLPIQNPSFHLTMKDYEYALKFKFMRLTLDPRGPKAYGQSRGVIALLEAEAETFDFRLSHLRAVERDNPELFGEMGVNRFRATLADGDLRPVRMQLPVLIDTNQDGLVLKVLAVRTNFTKVKLNGAFDGLVLPTMEIIINGKKYGFNQNAFERDVRKFFPEIVQLIQGGVKNYFERFAAAEIFQKEFDSVAKLATIDFTLPLAGNGSRPERIELKIRPSSVGLTDQKLQMDFHATMTDPMLKSGTGIFPAQGSASAPKLTHLPQKGYDVAFSIHPAIINGFVERLHHYQILSKVKIDESEDGKLVVPPVFRFDQADPRKAILHISLETKVKGLEKLAVRSAVPMEFDMLVALEPNAKNQIEIVPQQILIDSLSINEKKLKTTLGMFDGKVKKSVIERLKKKNEDYQSEREVLETIPTLDDVLGIPLKLSDVIVDRGNIVIFSKYDLN